MRRAVTLGGVAVVLLLLTALGATGVQHLYSDRQYRRLLADGERALASGDFYGAVEAFSGALAFRRDSMVAHLRRGEAYRGQRRYDEAMRDWREASRLAPQAPQPLVAMGDLFDATDRPGEAAEWYGQAADRLKGEDTALLYRLALARYRAGAPATAIEPLKQAAARNQGSAETHYLLGLAYRDTGQTANAIGALTTALAIVPDLVAAREELADLYRAEGRPVDEMAQLQALAAGDNQITRRVAIGLAEARQGQLDGALGTLSAALETAPNDSRVLLAIGRVYLSRAERNGDAQSLRGALGVLERALGGTAPRSEGLALYGRALHLSGDFTQAERILREAVSTSPVDPEAFQFLADTAERLGHHLIARDALMNLDALQGDTVPAETRAVRARRIDTLNRALASTAK
jgi:tetratricopeptide (TPR) repeat protein